MTKVRACSKYRIFESIELVQSPGIVGRQVGRRLSRQVKQEGPAELRPEHREPEFVVCGPHNAVG